MFLKKPRTSVTIMCRTENSADVCPGSKNHLDMRTPGADFLWRAGRRARFSARDGPRPGPEIGAA
jgi:hypothetical protein